MMQEKQSAMDQLAWLNNLPEGGGSWALGITATVESFEEELERLEAQKASLDVQIKARKKLVRAAVKRAAKEAPQLFGQKVVDKAQAVAAPVAG